MGLRNFIISNFLSVKSYINLIKRLRKKNDKGFYSISISDFFELLSKRPVKFIQIGANDGQLNDPIYPYIKQGQWKGVLVEPLPPLFEKLKQTYKGIEGLSFENVGITDSDGNMGFYFLPAEYNEPDWLQQIGTFDRKAIELNLETLPQLLPKVQTTTVATISLNTLFKRNKVNELDILIIDAEGFEYKILKQLEGVSIKPKYIFFEWGCMEKLEYDLLLKLLTDQGYDLLQSGGDMLALKK